MKRRDFLKGALMVSVLAPFSRLAAKAEKKAAAKPGAAIPSKVVRRTLNGMETPLLGYGTMRLPRKIQDEPDIDYAKAEQLFKRAMESGVNYFDTAYFYHRGLSEKCVGDLLSKYPRNSYLLADKMPVRMLKKEADMERIFNEQLKRCRTSFFDFYLMHALNGRNWKTAQRLKLYDFLKQKQKEGKIRYIGFSFHDKPAVLKEIAGRGRSVSLSEGVFIVFISAIVARRFLAAQAITVTLEASAAFAVFGFIGFDNVRSVAGLHDCCNISSDLSDVRCSLFDDLVNALSHMEIGAVMLFQLSLHLKETDQLKVSLEQIVHVTEITVDISQGYGNIDFFHIGQFLLSSAKFLRVWLS